MDFKNISAYAEESYFDENLNFEKNSIIITLTEEESSKNKNYVAKDFDEIGCVSIENLTPSINSKRVLKLILDNSNNLFEALEILNDRTDILVAGLNYIYSINSVSNDFYLEQNDLWGLNGRNGIKSNEAWDISTGSNCVAVGVLDTGIQANHSDLLNRISNDGLHRDCTVNPIMVVNNSDLIDPNGHGTHVAGIIGAQGNNAIGITGVCWDIRLVSLRVFDEDGYGNTESLIRAIRFTDEIGIPILNYSGGTTVNDLNLIDAIIDYDGLLVCAAGNGGYDYMGDNNDYSYQYPSEYSRDQVCGNKVISVGASDYYGNITDFSNFGKNSVSLFAPGNDILSTYPQSLCTGEVIETRWGQLLACECKWSTEYLYYGEWVPNGSEHYDNGYHYMSGTSMAAPFVSGTAALILSEYPELTSAQIKGLILENVVKDVDLKDLCVAGGRLNAFTAVSSAKVVSSIEIDATGKIIV